MTDDATSPVGNAAIAGYAHVQINGSGAWLPYYT
jgi:hypothetical protein